MPNSGQGGFRFTSPSAGSQPVNLIGGEGFAAAAVCPALYPTRQPGQSGGLPGERLYRAGATAKGSDQIATKAKRSRGVRSPALVPYRRSAGSGRSDLQSCVHVEV